MTTPYSDDPPPPVGEPTPVDDSSSLSVDSGLSGLFELAVAVVTSPGRAFDEIARRAPLGGSIVVVLTIHALTAATQMASATGSLAVAPSSATLGAQGLTLSPIVSLLVGLLVGAPFGLAATAVWTALVLLFARMLGGTGGYKVTFCGLAFATVPQVFTVIVTALLLPMGTAGTVLGVLAAIGVAVWTVVLSVMAVRSAHALSTGRAVAAVVLPVVAFVVVITLMAVAIIGLVVVTLT